MKKSILLCLTLSAVICLASFAHAKTYELKIQSSFANSSMFYKTLERLKDRIELLSQGQIKVELFADGAVVKSFEVFDSVSENIINGGQCWTHWASGKHPAGILFSAPVGGLGLGFDQMGHVSWLWEGEGLELLNEYYQKVIGLNLKAYPVLPMGPESFGWFNKKYTSAAEFKKIKFRAPPGVPSEAFKEFGMPVVSMSGVDIIPSAQRGVIDAAEWISPGEDIALGFHEIWKHFYLQGLHQAISVGDIYINLEWYNSLPKNLQAILDTAMYTSIADQLLMNVSLNSKALEVLVRDKGVTIEATPADYYIEFMAASRKTIDKYTSDPFFKKVYDSMYAWAKLTVPFQVRVNELYFRMGKTAMDEGIITDYKN